jgi:uncharacterized damage-inducible protein DinB
MNARELLVDTFAYIPPARTIGDLSADEAERRLSDQSHSIAEIVAHMNFWQTWFAKRIDGLDEPMVEHAPAGWPAVAPGGWKDLQSAFVAGVERLAALGAEEERLNAALAPAIAFPPLAHFTTRDALVHVAMHNAHHVGQIIVLRQMMGRWPPPGGGWTF